MQLLTERCKMTEIHEILAKHIRYPYHIGNEVPETPAYQTMHFGRNTVRLLATAPDLHKRIRELTRAYEGKGVASRQASFPIKQFITKESTRVWLGRKTEYPIVYHDCIPGKKWLKKHEHDVYPEPTIDIMVDGKTLNINGNYKTGMIQGFMGQFCRPGEGKTRLVKVK